MNPILLASTLILYPVWMPLFEERPVVSADVSITGKYSIQESTLEYLQNNITGCDEHTRAAIYKELASVKVRANQNLLLNTFMHMEKNPNMQASILRMLCNMDTDNMDEKLVRPYLDNENDTIKLAAIKLYGKLENADLAALSKYIGNPESTDCNIALQTACWQAIAGNARLANALGNQVLAFRNAKLASIKHLALQASMLLENRTNDINNWQKEASKSEDTSERLVVAKNNLAATPEIASTLLNDSNSGIRQAVCEAPEAFKNLDLMLKATEDQEQSVRIAALKAIAALRDCNDENVYKTIAKCFEDSSILVRQEAEKTYIAIGNSLGADILASQISEKSSEEFMLHSFNALKKLDAKQHADVIADILPVATRYDVIGAGLDALAMLAPKQSNGPLVIGYADSSSSLVRQMAVRAMGRLNIENSERLIINISHDKADHVRAEAFEAMGRFPRPVFLQGIMECLVNTRNTTYEERGNAAWALGFIRTNDQKYAELIQDLSDRLVVQCTVRVVPTDSMPIFDDTAVIGNCMFASAMLAKNYPGNTKDNFNQLIRIFDVTPDEMKQMQSSGGQDDLPRSNATWSIIVQLQQWFNGEEYTRQSPQDRPFIFPITPLNTNIIEPEEVQQPESEDD